MKKSHSIINASPPERIFISLNLFCRQVSSSFTATVISALFFMRIYLFFLWTFISCSIICFGQASGYKEVTAVSFKNLLSQEKGILLDVRTPGEYSQGHLAGAQNLNFYDPDFALKLKKLAAGKVAFIYCASGGRSAKAATILKDYSQAPVYNLIGGIAAWQKAGYPVVK